MSTMEVRSVVLPPFAVACLGFLSLSRLGRAG